jgi:hypothetical protein
MELRKLTINSFGASLLANPSSRRWWKGAPLENGKNREEDAGQQWP